MEKEIGESGAGEASDKRGINKLLLAAGKMDLSRVNDERPSSCQANKTLPLAYVSLCVSVSPSVNISITLKHREPGDSSGKAPTAYSGLSKVI